MDNTNFEPVKLERQLCFPLYAVSREVIKLYKPFLDELDLTYTQYITMIILWEHGTMTVKEMGDRLFLDSGTLTPLLKKLEAKGLITRTRSQKDERNLIIGLTEKGELLHERARPVPTAVSKYNPLTNEESATLYQLLYKMLAAKPTIAPKELEG